MSYSVSDLATVRKILGGTVKYYIPRYQRKYIWNDKHWQDLFDDLLFIYNNKKENPDLVHFFSTFIFEKMGNQNGVDCFNVIDGQQRLSTSMVIISAICRMLIEYKKETQHKALAQYLSALDSNGTYIKITNEDVDLLGEIIENSYQFKEISQLSALTLIKYKSYTNDRKNILKCYLFFYDKIKELIKDESTEKEVKNLMNFSDCLLNMQVVQIQVDKEQEGYDIFEILNARGTPLEQHELLKNYIFKFYKPAGDIDTAKRIWSDIENTLTTAKNNHLANFIDHYTIHKYEKPDKINTVLKIIKKANSQNSTKTILEDIYEKSKLYNLILNPRAILDDELFDETKIKDNIFSVLFYFNRKNQSQFRPLILSLFSLVNRRKNEYDEASELFSRHEITVEQFKKFKKEYKETETSVNVAITHLLHFSIIELVIKKQQPKEFEQKTHELARKIECGEYEIKSIYDLLPLNVTYDMFMKSFCLLGYSNKVDTYSRTKTGVDIRQILRMYELYLQGTDELTIDNYTIEHIMNDSADEIYSCYIGNILPISEEIQGDIGTETTLQGKMPHYKKSGFKSVQKFIAENEEKQEWTQSDIEKRAEQIAKTFYDEIFKIKKPL